MIELKNVSYGYNSRSVLEKVDFKEHDPVITCLWGRNGAGKTTLMKLMAGLYKPGQGTIEIIGQSPYNNEHAQKNLCFIQESHPFNPEWKIPDVLKIAKEYHPNWNSSTADQLLSIFKLPEKKKIKTFSKGMQTALQLIIGLSSHAEVTILDEPTNGLDAVMRKEFYKVLLNSYEEYPRLILLSTHHINEVQSICETIAVVHEQTIMFHQSMEEMREQGILLTGGREQIEKLIQGEKVLEREKLGNVVRVMIDAPYTEEWESKASSNNVEIEKTNLQDYLINKTKDHEGVKA